MEVDRKVTAEIEFLTNTTFWGYITKYNMIVFTEYVGQGAWRQATEVTLAVEAGRDLWKEF